MKKIITFGCTFAAAGVIAFAAEETKTVITTKMVVTSSAFQNGGKIPDKFACKGANVSPPLHIEGVPPQAKSLAIVMDDPDAPNGRFLHWLVWNIDPKTTDIAENSVPANAMQGDNGFGKAGYGGPCPPAKPHRYYFKVLALDLDKIERISPQSELEAKIQSHAISYGQIMGKYSKETQ